MTGRVGGIVFPAVPGGGNGSLGLVVRGAAFGVAAFGVAAFGVVGFGVVGFGVVGFGVVGFGVAAAPGVGALSVFDGAGCAHGSPGAARFGVSVLDGFAGCAHGSPPLAAPAALGESRGGGFDGFDAVSVCSTGIALGET